MEKTLAIIFLDRKQTWTLSNVLIEQCLKTMCQCHLTQPTVWPPIDQVTSENVEQSRSTKHPHVLYLTDPNEWE